MSIRGRILILSGAGAAVLMVSMAQFYRLSVLSSSLSAEGVMAAQTHLAVQRIDLLAYEYLLYGEPRARRQLLLQCTRLRTDARQFAASGNSYQFAIATELQRTETLLVALDVQRQSPAGEFIPRSVRSRFLAEQLIIASHEMFDQARRWQGQMIAVRESLLREATLSAVVASSIMLLVLTAGALLLLRTIVRPVERLRRAVAAVAAGDFTQRLQVNRTDEIGSLTLGFNQMTSALAIAAEARERTVELEARSAALESINRDLEQFAALASHDLQAPLRSIGSFTELIQRHAGDNLDEKSRTHLQRIVDATGRMHSLIDSLLRFARAGNVDVDQDTDLCCRTVLDQALENLAQPLSESAAILNISDLPMVHFNAVQLIQVFQNIVGNAIKYRCLDRQLHICISAQCSPHGYHTIAIADNGPGIAARYHDQIFGMFERGHGQEVSGSGIGLALCRSVIVCRGGEIRVESSLGHGATFYFTVPVAMQALDSLRPSPRLHLT